MVKQKPIKIDLSCKKTQADDILTKEGPRRTFTGTYSGQMNQDGQVVTVEVKFKSDNKEALEKVVPLSTGEQRMMALSPVNETLPIES